MNLERIKKLRDALANVRTIEGHCIVFDENEPQGKRVENARIDFDMSRFLGAHDGRDNDGTAISGPCNTAGCLAGWAVNLFIKNPTVHDLDTRSIAEVAGKILDLTGIEESALFLPLSYAVRTREEAIAVLDHILETGKIEWPDLTLDEMAARYTLLEEEKGED